MMQKDIQAALELGHASGVPLLTAALSGEMLSAAKALGYAEADFAILYDVLSRLVEK